MFIPKTIILEKGTREYEIGIKIYNYFKDKENIKIIQLKIIELKKIFLVIIFLTFIRKGKIL